MVSARDHGKKSYLRMPMIRFPLAWVQIMWESICMDCSINEWQIPIRNVQACTLVGIAWPMVRTENEKLELIAIQEICFGNEISSLKTFLLQPRNLPVM